MKLRSNNENLSVGWVISINQEISKSEIVSSSLISNPTKCHQHQSSFDDFINFCYLEQWNENFNFCRTFHFKFLQWCCLSVKRHSKCFFKVMFVLNLTIGLISPKGTINRYQKQNNRRSCWRKVVKIDEGDKGRRKMKLFIENERAKMLQRRVWWAIIDNKLQSIWALETRIKRLM